LDIEKQIVKDVRHTLLSSMLLVASLQHREGAVMLASTSNHGTWTAEGRKATSIIEL